MGLFGPSVREMTDAVERGIHQAIRTTNNTSYAIKKGKLPFKGKYICIVPKVEVSLEPYDPRKVMPELNVRKVPVQGNDIVYDVIEIKTSRRYNPFTDTVKESTISEREVARYYSYNGWNSDKINRLIQFALAEGYYPSDERLADIILSEDRYYGR